MQAASSRWLLCVGIAWSACGCSGSGDGGLGSGGSAGSAGQVSAAGAGSNAGSFSAGGSSSGASSGGANANGGRSSAGDGGKSGSGAGSGGSAAEPWRPYSADSPWNTPIPENPALDPENAAMISDFVTSSEWPFLGINISGFSVPLYWADASTPMQAVTAELGGQGFNGANGFNATAQVPIPADAAPDGQSDHHMLVVDRARNMEWGFFNARHMGTTWSCGLCATSDLSGSGVRPPDVANPTWWTSHGPRACGFSLVAGLIRVEEIQAGAINHALVIAYPHIRAGRYTPPASTSQAANGVGASSSRGIPCGGRIQLDPSVNLDSLGLSASGKIVARALQLYGAYVGDYSGAMSLYAENTPAARALWSSGVLDTYEIREQIRLESFRVLRLGTVYDGRNGD